MRNLFDEYGSFLLALVGSALLIGTIIGIFWGNSSPLQGSVEGLINSWVG